MIREESVGPARVVTLARPEKKNALSYELMASLASAVERAGEDASVRAVVLCAEGSVFASGGDLVELDAIVGDPGGAARVLAMGREVEAIFGCSVPVIAAVSGDVYGGGCELVLGCDMALMEEHTRISFRHARMGLSPAWGGTARLLERVGPTVSAKLLFGSALVEATEASRMGLVTEAVPRGTSLDRALALTEEIAHADRAVITAQKLLLGSALAAARRAVKEHEARTFEALWGGAAHRAAMARFKARRS